MAAAVVALLAIGLHLPVFTRGALITPAGMHHAQWPWRATPPPQATGGGPALLGENPTLSDLLFQVYPWQLHMSRSLAAGSVPLWNPYSYCGVPFVANAQSAVFYPLHWPVWILPSMRVFTFALLAKILLAGVFMAVFLVSLGARGPACVVGSVSFALCSFMTSWLGYAHTNAAVLLPLLMLAARMLARAPNAAGFLLLVFAGAAQYLGGHPETSVHIIGAATLYFLWNLPASPRPRLAVWLFAAAGLLGFLMAAVQMFPFLDYLASSAALAQRQASTGMDPTLPARALAANLLPGMYGWPWRFTFHGPAAWQALVCYTGAGTLLLALVSLRWPRGVVFFQVLAAVSAVVVYGPGWIRAIIRHVPVVGIGSNNRLTLLISFCIAVLAAHALERVSQVSAGAPRPERLKTVGALAVAAVPLLAVIVLLRGSDPDGARLALSIVAGTALLTVVALLFRPGRRALYLGGIAALVCIDLFVFAWRFNPHADPDALFPATPLTDYLRQDAAGDMVRGGRMMTVGWVMRPETQMVYRLSSIEGYDAMELARYRRLIDRASVASIHETGAVPPGSRPLLDLAGLRYIVTPPGGVVSGEKMTLGYDGPDGRVFINEQALPRFWFVETARAVHRADGAGTLERLASGRFDPRTQVLIEDPDAAIPAGSGSADAPAPATARITLERNTAGAIALTVAARGRPGYLVVSDAWDGGWRALVNGRPARVLRADYAFRAVPIPAGEAKVTMSYRPGWFRAGAWTSVLTLMFAITVVLVQWGRETSR